MRELFLLVSLISLGYFAQSSIGLALNRSCEIYEDIAIAVRNKTPEACASNPAVTIANSKASRNSAPRVERRPEFDATLESNEDQLGLMPIPDLHEVKISQTGSKASQEIR